MWFHVLWLSGGSLPTRGQWHVLCLWMLHDRVVQEIMRSRHRSVSVQERGDRPKVRCLCKRVRWSYSERLWRWEDLNSTTSAWVGNIEQISIEYNIIHNPQSNLIPYLFLFSCVRFLPQIIPARYLVGPHSIWSNGDPSVSQWCGWKCRSTLLREWLGRTGHVQMHVETIFRLSFGGETWYCPSKTKSCFIHICHISFVFDLSIK